MLREAGYAQRHDSKQLTKIDPENEVEFFYLRPRDIAVYVGEGTLDAGITGRDLLLDSGAGAEEILRLGFGHSRFRFAALPGTIGSEAELAGKRIATSYAGVVNGYLRERGSKPPWCASTALSRPASSSVSPTLSPTSSKPAVRCARRDWRSSVR